MKINIYWLVLLLSFTTSTAQDYKLSNGIQWEIGHTWEQVKQRAKQENKYIFVDAYATWCGPCKLMDKNVYLDSSVGAKMNKRFISVKVQMDTSKKDDSSVQRWYSDALTLKTQYNITGFPSLLFFSPNGILVHKSLGYKSTTEFIDLASTASNPEKQFYTLLHEYKSGKKNYDLLPYMIETAINIKDKELEVNLARDYIENVLYKKNEKELFQKERLYLIGEYIQTSQEKGFKYFIKNEKRINSLLNKRTYVQSRIDKVINKEEILPQLDQLDVTDNEPLWDAMKVKIKEKYGNDISNRVILSAQLNWYRNKKDWSKLAQFNIEKIEKYGLDTIGLAKAFTNNMIWDVFFIHCNDIVQLKKAIEWMGDIVRANPYDANSIDTYANLFYKSGEVLQAIKWESIAAKLSPDNKQIQFALECMMHGVPTYTKEGAVWSAETLSKLNNASLSRKLAK